MTTIKEELIKSGEFYTQALNAEIFRLQFELDNTNRLVETYRNLESDIEIRKVEDEINRQNKIWFKKHKPEDSKRLDLSGRKNFFKELRSQYRNMANKNKRENSEVQAVNSQIGKLVQDIVSIFYHRFET